MAFWLIGKMTTYFPKAYFYKQQSGISSEINTKEHNKKSIIVLFDFHLFLIQYLFPNL